MNLHTPCVSGKDGAKFSTTSLPSDELAIRWLMGRFGLTASTARAIAVLAMLGGR
jgi:hypothetical protein